MESQHGCGRVAGAPAKASLDVRSPRRLQPAGPSGSERSRGAGRQAGRLLRSSPPPPRSLTAVGLGETGRAGGGASPKHARPIGLLSRRRRLEEPRRDHPGSGTDLSEAAPGAPAGRPAAAFRRRRTVPACGLSPSAAPTRSCLSPSTRAQQLLQPVPVFPLPRLRLFAGRTQRGLLGLVVPGGGGTVGWRPLRRRPSALPRRLAPAPRL